MSIVKASASYKKQDGTLIFARAKDSVSWTPVAPPGSASQLTIAIADISNLQQTPAASAKVALKVVVQAAGTALTKDHVFSFTSPTVARAEQEAATDALRTAISALRSGSAPTVTAPGTPDNSGPGGQSAAMAIASAVTSGAQAADGWYDDRHLKSNVELQQSLLGKDPALRQRFEESLRQKPESISNLQFSLQFWSARLHLLRAHAIERTQSQGSYNVLSEIKPKIVDGATRLNLSKEQIHLIFDQHPIVKHVYNEVVPKLSERDFWARFFVSRLFKKLKGERLTDADSTDAILDEYVHASEDSFRSKQVDDIHLPHFIDLEGNEQNHSQRKGNAPDFTMRPGTTDRVPILRVLNNMSEKMLSNVAPADGALHAPIGMDEDTYNELRLRDLQADAEEDRLVLSVQDQSQLFVGEKNNEANAEASMYNNQDANMTLAQLRKDLGTSTKHKHGKGGSGLDLATAIGFREDSDVDSDVDMDDEAGEDKVVVNGKVEAGHRANRVGGQAALTAATSQIFALVAQQSERLNHTVESRAVKTSLTPETLQSLQLTQNTTSEFLHYFWSLLHSPPSAATDRDLPSLTVTLKNSRARIDAVAEEAEKERQARIAEAKRQATEYQQRTGRRRKVDESMMVGVGFGGRREVERLVASTIRSITSAESRYSVLYGKQIPASGRT